MATRYREILHVDNKQVEYIGVYIKLYGLDDLFISYYYNELLREGHLSTAASIAGISHEVTRGNTDKQLRCIAETTEGRRLLSNHTYWGSEVHLAADGEYRWAPDWYIDPKGPTGYVVHGKMYSKYLYGPLSKEEFYRRNVGRGIPEPPSVFTSLFGGVTGLFTNALGLSRLLTPDPPPEVIPVRERLDLGLSSPIDSLPGGPVDPANIPLPDTDDRDLESLPGDLEGDLEEEPEEAPASLPGGPEEEPGEEFEPLPTISEDVVVPTDKEEYQRFLDEAMDHIAAGLERIDTANQEELDQFAKQLGVKMAGRSIAAKRIFMKSVLIRQTARITKSGETAFDDLLTYHSISGDYLPLAPDTVSKVEEGLDIISRKLTFEDLKAFGSIHNMSGTSKLKVDALRKRVLGYYIGKIATEYLTDKEKKKFKPDKHKKEYGIG